MEAPRETPPHLSAIEHELVQREPIFHRHEYGTTREALESMTEESFWEVGASGRRYSRSYVIDTLLERYSRSHQDEWQTKDFYCQEIARDSYLLTYTLHQGVRVTRRATLWRHTPTGWKIVYHQGTAVEEERKTRSHSFHAEAGHPEVVVRPAAVIDVEAIRRIYNHYVLETVCTFEQQPVSPEKIAARIAEVTAASLPWLVAEQEGSVIGYAYASKWKERSPYRFAVETTIYLAPGCLGKSIGTTLYRALLKQLKDMRLHTAIGGVALPNAASVALHEKLGFRKVAQFAEVGFKFDTWIDVGYWQFAL